MNKIGQPEFFKIAQKIIKSRRHVVSMRDICHELRPMNELTLINNEINKEDFYIASKIDGLHSVAFVNEGILFILTDDINECHEICVEVDENDIKLFCDVLIEGEFIPETKIFVIHNIIKEYSDAYYKTVKTLDEYTKLNKYTSEINFKSKPIIKLSDYKSEKQLMVDFCDNDGFVLTHKEDIRIIYKLKTAEFTTIDLYIGKHSGNIVLLSSNEEEMSYSKMIDYTKKLCLFQPPFNTSAFSRFEGITDDDIGKVFEFKVDTKRHMMVPIRERTDKKIPNNIKTAYDNYCVAFNPVTIDMLFTENLNKYFRNPIKEKPSYVGLNNIAKKIIYRKFIHKYSRVLDIGCGEGEDIAKFNSIPIKAYFALDPVFNSLHELESRILESRKFRYKFYLECFPQKAEDIEEFSKFKFRVDTILFAFSIHYVPDIKKIIEFYKEYLVKEGKIIILYLDTTNKKEIDIINNLYHLKIDDKNIKIKLPFSGDDIYTEQQLSEEMLMEIAKECNLNVSLSCSLCKFTNTEIDYSRTKEYIEGDFANEFIDNVYHDIHRVIVLN